MRFVDCVGQSGGHRIVRIGLTRAPAALAVGPVDLDDGDLVGKDVPGQSGPVAAGAFDTDQLEGAEALEPAQQLLVAGARGARLSTPS